MAGGGGEGGRQGDGAAGRGRRVRVGGEATEEAGEDTEDAAYESRARGLCSPHHDRACEGRSARAGAPDLAGARYGCPLRGQCEPRSGAAQWVARLRERAHERPGLQKIRRVAGSRGDSQDECSGQR